MTLFSTVQLLLPYWSQNPTLVSWIHRPLTVHPVPSEPSIALAVLSSCRPTVEPRIAKLLRLIGPETDRGVVDQLVGLDLRVPVAGALDRRAVDLQRRADQEGALRDPHRLARRVRRGDRLR
jgi:hypothetical protein